MLARIVLEKGGVCYGSALEKENGMFAAKHVRIDSLGELPKILNSKYIPSVTGMAFLKAKEDLVQGRLVLFSGTPCQIQGLMAFLGRDYGNLLTADLVCHGITSTNLFNDYLACLEKTEGIGITDFSFRDKSVSWGTNYCFAYYKKTDGKKREKRRHCPREASSYMHHYLRGNIFRENCYSCSRSNTERVSDFTLGDYWEIESEHPEFVTKYSPRISLRRGVSCILVNSPKAEEFVELLEDKMILHAVTLESIVAHNSNLAEPSPRGMDRDRLLQMYRECGYEPIEEEYRRLVADRMKVYYLKNTLKSRLPDWIRVLIYRSSVLRKLVFRL